MSLDKAMLAIQGELSGVVKDSSNPHFKNRYASLAAVIATCKPVLQKHGVYVVQSPSKYEDGVMSVMTRICHAESGEHTQFLAQAPVSKRDPQGAMGAVTYLQRYSYLGAFGLPSLDDDGESAIVKTESLEKSMNLCETKEALNQWGIDMADTIQESRGNKAELKRKYKALMDRLPSEDDNE